VDDEGIIRVNQPMRINIFFVHDHYLITTRMGIST